MYVSSALLQADWPTVRCGAVRFKFCVTVRFRGLNRTATQTKEANRNAP